MSEDLGVELAKEVARLGKGHDYRDVTIQLLRCAALAFIRGEIEAGEKRITEGDFMASAQEAFETMARLVAERDGMKLKNQRADRTQA